MKKIKVKFESLSEIIKIINNLKKDDVLKLYFEDYCYDDYYKIKNNKVYNRYNEIEYDDINDFIYNNAEIEFSYYII